MAGQGGATRAAGGLRDPMGRLGYGPGRLKSLYDGAPVWAQHLMTTAYGCRLAWRVQGREYRRHYRELEETQWLGRAELEELQVERIRRLLRVAARETEHWPEVFAEYGFDPNRFQRLDDLRVLPPLEKEAVREAGNSMVARPALGGEWPVVESRTSGTTGKALRVVLTREAWIREHAFRWLHRSWGGVRRGERTATLAGQPVVPTDVLAPPYWRYNAVERQLLFSSQHIGPATVGSYVERMREFRPVLIHGYPSALTLLARHILSEGKGDGVRSLAPRAVFTHSETLLDAQRELLEQAFGCRVYNWYGTSEHLGNIVECDRGSLHLKEEHSYLEFVHPDGRPARPGEVAEIWATGFGNLAMPFIRYRTGDTAILREGSCPCGRGGRLVERVVGRVEDFIVTPDGRYVGRLDHVFKGADRVYEAQLVQDRVEELRVRIVPRPGFGEEDRAAIEEELRVRLGPSIGLRFELVDSIGRGPNGKFRFVVSGVKGAELVEGAGDAGRG